MKDLYKNLIFVFIFTMSLSLFAQIPNPGFEQWSAGNPDGWITTNLIGLGTPITQVSPAHSGTSALQGQVITDMFNDTIPPVLIGGNIGQGFPISSRYSSLTGYYKYSPLGGDEFIIFVIMYKNSSAIGSGSLYISTASANFSQFTVPIDYFTSDTPDESIIEISIEDPLGYIAHPGSYYIIDDLAFSQTTGIQNGALTTLPADYQLDQNYPNPFNPVTHIRYAVPQPSQVKLEVYNSLGQKVADLVNEQKAAGQYTVAFDASQLPSGLYFYQIQAGRYEKVMKMMLMK